VSGAREEILGRIRAALADVPEAEGAADVPVPRDYRRGGAVTGKELVARFAERIRDYHADVRRVRPGDLAGAVAAVCAETDVRRLVVPPGVPDEWRPTGVELVDDHGLSPSELDAIDGALTGCAAAIAETGTLVLDGHGVCGRRLLTLIPDHHICVVQAEQIVALVSEAISRLRPAVTEQAVPVTLVSGPSASSDIELNRVEGVHGPRHLQVFILEGKSTE